MSDASQPTSGSAPKKVPSIDDLKNLPDDKVGKKVRDAEGVSSSPVNVYQPTRQMQFYAVSESELRQLSLVNSLVAFAWAIVSGTALFLLDVGKDVVMTDAVPAQAISLASVFWPLLLFFFVASAIGLVLAYRWRGRLIELIKQESRDRTHDESAVVKTGRLRFQWPLTTN